MRDIWVISDTHFGHDNIIRYCDRPFENSKEMDERMLDNWNSVVRPGDIVYHLGDVYFNKSRTDWGSFFAKLCGAKRLILGNHDDGKDKLLQNTFQKIMMWRMFPEFGLLLTHVPVHDSALKPTDNRHDGIVYNLKNIHGHIHQNPSPEGPYQNVSVEQINYTPVHIEDLRVV